MAGTNGRDDDDLNTDYAESDVMLGGGTGTNSNGSNNGNGSPEDRSNNMVASTRYWERTEIKHFKKKKIAIKIILFSSSAFTRLNMKEGSSSSKRE